MRNPNPVLEVYNGIPIRKNNIFHLRMGAVLLKTLILESERTGIPISKILVYSSQPCSNCSSKTNCVEVKGKLICVSRGLLGRHITQPSGASIIKRANAKAK